MKKLFLLFATATLLVGAQACKQKEDTTSEEATEVVTDSATVTPVDTTTAATPVAVDTTKKK